MTETKQLTKRIRHDLGFHLPSEIINKIIFHYRSPVGKRTLYEIADKIMQEPQGQLSARSMASGAGPLISRLTPEMKQLIDFVTSTIDP
jgi:hypothetical protein